MTWGRTGGGESQRSKAIATHVLGSESLGTLEDYARARETAAPAAPLSLDFRGAPEASRATINAWVLERTQRRIAELLPHGSVDEETRAVLVNAVCFRGLWAHAFDRARTTDEGCGQQLVFPDLDIRRDLPLNEPVAVDITMPASGRVAFTCGMAMYQGSVVAQ